MRYDRPGIVRREPLAGLLVATKSDIKQPPPDVSQSDVNLKTNVVPVRW
jgi:hypothetical protein